jgi:Zn finger protein HypA/HybF involved in hydrogenase expression
MSDLSHSLLVEGIACAKAGDKKQARDYLEWMLRLDPTLEDRMDAWYWLSQVSDDPKIQRGYAEDILAHNPTDPRARRQLAILDGKLKPDKIIDPDHLEVSAPHLDQGVDASRYTCPKCGGRMTYTPDGQSLTCEFCETRQQLGLPGEQGPISIEQDFVIAMATNQGHFQPNVQYTFDCQGCGARFIFSERQLTTTCPFCQSNYVILSQEAHEIIDPHVIIPFSVNEDNAKEILRAWLSQNPQPNHFHVIGGTGIYLPAWIFSMGGTIRWTGKLPENFKKILETGNGLVYQADLIVPATKRLSEVGKEEFQNFQVNALQPFDSRFLVDWIAETYQVNVGDAALLARQMARSREISRISNSYNGIIEELTVSTTDMLVDTYKLALLPFWLTHIVSDTQKIEVVINGQTGNLRFHPKC